jgi:hypothetical protein
MPSRVRATYVGHRTNPVTMHWLFHDRGGPTGRLLDQYSLRVLAEARRRVGVNTGRLLATIRRDFGTGALGPYAEVIAGQSGITDYLGYHMFGTEPHVITPRRRKVLRFVSHGRLVYAVRVRHPGNRANPFLTDALNVLR